MSKEPRIKQYDHPAGGWGSVKAVSSILMQEHVAVNGTRILFKQNKPDGFACVSCSWAKPADPHLFEFCENGAKATAWEITTQRATRSSSITTPWPRWKPGAISSSNRKAG